MTLRLYYFSLVVAGVLDAVVEVDVAAVVAVVAVDDLKWVLFGYVVVAAGWCFRRSWFEDWFADAIKQQD